MMAVRSQQSETPKIKRNKTETAEETVKARNSSDLSKTSLRGFI
jgi:hypothetical protein